MTSSLPFSEAAFEYLGEVEQEEGNEKVSAVVLL
jgi:hypothetical protein